MIWIDLSLVSFPLLLCCGIVYELLVCIDYDRGLGDEVPSLCELIVIDVLKPSPLALHSFDRLRQCLQIRVEASELLLHGSMSSLELLVSIGVCSLEQVFPRHHISLQLPYSGLHLLFHNRKRIRPGSVHLIRIEIGQFDQKPPPTVKLPAAKLKHENMVVQPYDPLIHGKRNLFNDLLARWGGWKGNGATLL